MQRIPPELTGRARRLRSDATRTERDLWAVLRSVRPRFTRQLVVDRYILDFACRRVRLAVEIDGGHHAVQVAEDAIRTAYLEREGWTVLRFWNGDVHDDPEAVLQIILAAVARGSTHPRPLPSREGS